MALGSSGAFANNYKFTGEQLDPGLGFYYLRARYFNPGTGGFVSMDSYSGSLNNPISLNKYLYTHASPVMWVDPSGRITLAELSTTLGVVANLQTVGSLGLNLAVGNYAGAAADSAELVLAAFTGPGGNLVAKYSAGAKALFGKFVNRVNLNLTSKGSGSILGQNMIKLFGAGSRSANTAAHHVIPSKPISDQGKEARALLNKSGININNPLNGIFVHSGGDVTAGVIGAIHIGPHNKVYEQRLLSYLIEAGAHHGLKKQDLQVAVVNGVARMKQAILSGEVEFNKHGVLQ